ncbi:MAG TPA: glycosyltransferase family 39 protein [Pyrinomonadaceae bacterium]|nr:glycosyltransferase family 39 protein [Pyrinomonadaceae bacterium]
MSASTYSIVTAASRPDLFAERGIVSINRTVLFALLSVLVLAGFGFRVTGLSAEGLSEDELNKLQAVTEYREQGLTSANSEHPLLMKALLTGSVVSADKWNSIPSLGGRTPIAPETALRFPAALFGALTVVLIYLLGAELFGAEVGLIAAALWAFDPMAIGFNRIAKEDTFLVFFFLLGNIFWTRAQRIAETRSPREAERYYWAAAAALGAMMASKYLPQLVLVAITYYYIFQGVPATRWRLGKIRLLKFYGLMFVVFLLLNPTILFPATWHQMSQFAGQKRIGHDAYEFMGTLYPHRFTDWLRGIPWYFYHLFIVVKLPVLTVVAFLAGLPLIFRRKLGDGRYFLMLWFFLWMMTFSPGGGKFTRYFTTVLPAVLITAAIGVQALGSWLGKRLSSLLLTDWPEVYVRPVLALIVIAGSLGTLSKAAPHFRLYTNAFGGGAANAGYYFPHDEFYDASMREAVFEIAKRAAPGTRVASESQTLCSYYAQRAGRPDLVCVFLSDPNELRQMREGDFMIDARGRRYFSNDAILAALKQSAEPAFRLSLGNVPSAAIYQLDRTSLDAMGEAVRQMPSLSRIMNPLSSGS